MVTNAEQPALLIIDMVKDNFRADRKLPITPLARRIIEPLNCLIGLFHEHDWPVVFSTDAFKADDFIFSERMPPHSLAGTEGAEVIEDLYRDSTDYWLPKPRFSAFFGTGLAGWLRERGVTLCAVGGIATHFCVLSTVLLADGSAAPTEAIHGQTLNVYRRNPLYPLLRVMESNDLVEDLLAR
jgi:nicotinamidase-related amidase